MRKLLDSPWQTLSIHFALTVSSTSLSPRPFRGTWKMSQSPVSRNSNIERRMDRPKSVVGVIRGLLRSLLDPTAPNCWRYLHSANRESRYLHRCPQSPGTEKGAGIQYYTILRNLQQSCLKAKRNRCDSKSIL